jgi:transcription-repair coupling factor (superfamily II helicase)
VLNLLAVARFRQLCRSLGLAEVAVAGTMIRIGPLDLPDSKQMRFKRMHPKGQYKPAARLVAVPKPTVGNRIGGAPLRDLELLDWLTALVEDLATPVPVA